MARSVGVVLALVDMQQSLPHKWIDMQQSTTQGGGQVPSVESVMADMVPFF
jgi:hypothetical protein